MNRRTIWLPLIVLGFLATVILVAWAQSARADVVPLDKVPVEVKATLLKEADGGEILKVEREIKGGKIVYEAKVAREGTTFEITIAADGTLLGRELEEEGEIKDEDEDEDEASKPEEQERVITEAEVPTAALATLKKLAAGARITEFAEEIEHGSRFYEGSWKSASGNNVDALVTSAGDIVEIEEQINPDQVPAAVLAAARKIAGPNGELFCEKKTMILYEVKYRKGDQRHEVLYAPDGRVVEQNVEKGQKDDD